MSAADKLIVALDVNDRERAMSIVTALRPRLRRFKVGLELYTACGPALIRELQEGGCQLFLDLKFHDIPNTAARAAVEVARLGADMFTIHLSGGPLMARRVVDELHAYCEIYRLARPRVLGVTVLTSLARADQQQLGVTCSVEEQVVRLAAIAAGAGLDGVVASAHEIEPIRSVGGDLLIVTPGIRPPGADTDDQARTRTPKEAIQAGADYLVVGRPIVRATDPLAAAESILMQMDDA